MTLWLVPVSFADIVTDTFDRNSAVATGAIPGSGNLHNGAIYELLDFSAWPASVIDISLELESTCYTTVAYSDVRIDVLLGTLHEVEHDHFGATLPTDDGYSGDGTMELTTRNSTYASAGLRLQGSKLYYVSYGTDCGQDTYTKVDGGDYWVFENYNHEPTVANPVANQNATEDTAFSFQAPVDLFTDIEDTADPTPTLHIGDPAVFNPVDSSRRFSGILTNGGATFGDSQLDSTTAWLGADEEAPGQWIELPLPTGQTVFGVVTQGRHDFNVWTTKFTASVFDANGNETPLANGIEFSANSDKRTKVFNQLDIPAGSRWLRLYPTEWMRHPGMRVGLAASSWLFADGDSISGTALNGDAQVTVYATGSDSEGRAVEDTFDVSVVNVNDAPTVATAVADQSATEDVAYSINLPASLFADVDAGDSVTVSVTTKPDWLSFSNGTLSGTPANADVGVHSVTVTGTDGSGAWVSDTFTVTVANVNDAPTVAAAVADQSATQEVVFSVNLPASIFADVDAGDSMTVSVTDKPDWLSFSNGTLSGTPANADVGVHFVTVRGVDGSSASVLDSFSVTVANVNDAPTVAAAVVDQAATEEVAFAVNLPASIFADGDVGDSVTVAVTTKPDWLSFSNGRLFGTPANQDTGVNSVTVTGIDGSGASVSDIFSVTVANVNDAPVVAAVIPDQNATQGTAFSFTIPAATFNDVDAGDNITLSVTPTLPGWLSFNTSTGVFSGTPGNSDVATESITVQATDDSSATVSDSFDITIANINDAPTVANAIDDQSINEDEPFSLAVPTSTFDDVDDGDSVAVSIESGDAPNWLTFNAGILSGTPSNSEVGEHTIIVTGTDESSATVTDTFVITVVDVNDAPTIAFPIANLDATEDLVFSYQAAADVFADIEDSANPTITMHIGDPAVFNPQDTTRRFSGILNGDSAGTGQGRSQLDSLDGWSAATAVTGHWIDLPLPSNQTVFGVVTQGRSSGNSWVTQFTASVLDASEVETLLANGATFNANTDENSKVYTPLDIPAGSRWLRLYPTSWNGYPSMRAGLAASPWLLADGDSISGTPLNGDEQATVYATGTDSGGLTITDSFDVAVIDVNDFPTVAAAVVDQSATEEVAFAVNLPSSIFIDVDAGDSITVSVTTKPDWLSFSNGTVSGTPANADVGVHLVTVTGTDNAGASVSDSFTVTVANVNDAPTVVAAVADQSATEEVIYSLNLPNSIFADVDAGDSVTVSVTTKPDWLSFASGTLSGTPANDDAGGHSVAVTGADNSGATASDSFTVSVANVNDAPTVVAAVADQSATEEVAFSVNLPESIFADIDAGDSVAVSVTAKPGWLSFANGILSGTPTNADAGVHSVTVTGTDNSGAAVSDTFTVTVTKVNDAPTLAAAVADQFATEEVAFSLDLPESIFADVDAADSITVSVTAKPAWLSFANGTLSGTPANADYGVHSVTVAGTDTAGASVSDSFTVTVANVNDAPTVVAAVADQSATQELAFSVNLAASIFADVDAGDVVTVSVTTKPDWLSFAGGNLSGTPANTDVGDHLVTLTGTDNAGAAVADTFVVSVGNVNDTPTVATVIADQAATEDTPYTFTIPASTFSDVDAGDSLSLTTSTLPGWLSFNAGVFSGTPLNADVGSVSISVTASDSQSATVTDTFVLVVANDNDLPTLANAIADQDATEDSLFSFSIPAATFNDVDADDSLTLSAPTLPAWLSFDVGSATLSGTPTNDHIGASAVTIRATDEVNESVEDNIVVLVSNVNDAPTVDQGIDDQSANEDIAWSLTIPANAFADVDVGDALSYSIVSGPAWLSVNDGVLEGTPAQVDVGTVVVTVQATDTGAQIITTSFSITVAEVNNNAPVFSSATAVSIAENTIGTIYTGLVADADTGDTVSFSISGPDVALFAIDTNSAELIFLAPPDHENAIDANADNVYEVVIRATDAAAHSTDLLLAVTVNDVNDVAPTLTSNTTVSVSEGGTATGYTATASDPDTGDTIEFAIKGGADAGSFDIDATTGTLSFSQIADYESPQDADSDNVYEVILRARDVAGNDGVLNLTVNVSDANDNAPVFTSAASIEFAENTTVTGYTATAVDPDTADTIVFAISGGDDATHFAIDPATGVVSAVATLDHENPADANTDGVYQIILSATDSNTLVATHVLNLTVTDLNDTSPVFISSDSVTISEDNYAVAYTTSATDPDEDDTPPRSLIYAISGGVDQALFSMDATTGVLTFNSAPDFENPDDTGQDHQYNVSVEATDTAANVSVLDVVINLTDANDNAPMFTSSATAVIPEGTTGVFYTATADDADTSDSVTFTIASGNDAALFSIDPVSGALSVSAVDFELPGVGSVNNVYNLTLRGTDSGMKSKDHVLAVVVDDVNDNSPMISSIDAVEVDENTVAAFHLFTATDPDSDDLLSWSFAGGDDDALFAIDSSTGALSFIVAADAEAPADTGADNIYDILVQASDESANLSSQAFSVTVVNLNDTLPLVTPVAATSITENSTTSPYTLVATDSDAGDSVTYAIDGGDDAALFSIDAGSGVLSFDTAPDHEAPEDADTDNVYHLRLAAHDAVDHISTIELAITVTDLNDTAPTITSVATLVVPEGSTATTYNASSSDPDSADTVSYSITGADAALFSINSASGQLSFATAPDFENPADAGADNVLDIILSATDEAGNNTSQPLQVTVNDINDEIPVFASESTAGITEGATTAIYTASATDADADDSDALSFSVSGGVDAALFTIDSTTGALSVITAPDFENPADAGADNVLNIILSATDSAGSSSSLPLSLTVSDVNDEAPVFDSDSSVAVDEGSTTAFYTAAVTDADSGDVESYIITGADVALFSIDANSGALEFNTPPDFENPSDAGNNNTFDLILSATDAAGNSTSQALQVLVNDLNDEVPLFLSASTASVAEGSTAVFYTAVASDADAGDVLDFSITGGVDASHFEIDAASGALQLLAAANFEAPDDANGDNIYNITLSVADAVDNTVSLDLTIGLDDTNEAPNAVDLSVAFGEFTAPGTVVGQLIASDQDIDTLRWSLIDTNLPFAVTSGGELYVVTELDFETSNLFIFDVEVSDGLLSDTAEISITLTDESEITRLLDIAPNDIAAMTAEGVSGAVSGREDYYSAAIDAADPAPSTLAELQMIIDQANAIATTVEGAGTINNGPVSTQLIAAGITAVVEGNADLYERAIAGAETAPVSSPQLQAIVDEVNSVSDLVAEADQIDAVADIVASLTSEGIVDAATGRESYYIDSIETSVPVPSTLAELQVIIDSANATAEAVESIGTNTGGPLSTQLIAAGISGVAEGNIEFYERAIASADAAPTTAAQLQAIVDEVNIVSALISTATQFNSGSDTVDALGNEGITDAVVGREKFYKATIEATDPAPTTIAELQLIIDQANATAETLENVANGFDNDEPVTTLLTAAGISEVSQGDADAYGRAIAAADPAPTTAAQLQSIVDEVNTINSVIAEAGLVDAATTIVNTLSSEGITDAVIGRQDYYTDAINAVDPSPATRVELQEIIDLANAVAETLESVANGSDINEPVSTLLIAAGISGVSEDNAQAYERAIADIAPTTAAELQTIVDKTNSVGTLVTLAGQIDTDIVMALDNEGIADTITSREVFYRAAIEASDPAPSTIAELQNIIDLANATAETLERIGDRSDSDEPVSTQLIDAGFSRVTEDNAESYQRAIAAADPAPTTAAQLQAIVDEVNTVTAIIAEAGQTDATATIINTLSREGITEVVIGREDYYTASIETADPAPATLVELQAIIDLANTVAETLESAGNGEPVSTQLVAAGITGVRQDNADAYHHAISIADIAPTTATALQDIVAEVNAVGALLAEAGQPNSVVDIVAALGSEGISGAVADRENYYKAAIESADPVPATIAELQAVIDLANATAETLENVANGTDNDEPVSTLLIAAGVDNVTEIDTEAYERAIASADPAPTTAAELQAIVDEVNTVNSVLSEASQIGVALINTLSVEGIADAVTGREDYYKAAIDAADPAPIALAELQAIIDLANATADAVENAGNGADSDEPFSTQLINAGIGGVTQGNSVAYERAIAAADIAPTTAAQLQIIVDEVNTVSALVAEAVQANSVIDIVAALGSEGITGAVTGREDYYKAAIDTTDPAPATIAELQPIIDLANATAETMENLANGTDNDEPVSTHLNAAGIDNVAEIDAEAYERAIAAADPAPTTAAQLQAIVDEVNSVIAVIAEVAQIDSVANIVDTLNGEGISEAVAGRDGYYNAAIETADPVPTTLVELQNVIDLANAIADTVEGAVYDINNDEPLSTQLIAVGISGVTQANAGAYKRAIAAAEIAPTTDVELQAIIDEVNTVSALVSLAGQIDITTDIVAALGSEGIADAVTGREVFYRAAIEVSNPAPTTIAELQEIIDLANATAETLENAGNGIDDNEPVSTQLIAAGISGVTEGDAQAYERAIASTDPAPTTAAELQAIVDEVNTVIAMIAVADQINVDIVNTLSIEGIANAVAGREDYYRAAIDTADPLPTTMAELQNMIDVANATADVVENAGNGTDSDEPVSAQLMAAGVYSVVVNNADAYKRAIAAADIAATTSAELQIIVDEVNTVTTLVSEASQLNSGIDLVASLSSEGITDAVVGREDYYRAAINTADPVPATLAELQLTIDLANITGAMLENIGNGSDNNESVSTQLTAAGISGVTEGNADAYESAIAAADPAPTSTAQLQAIVDEVNVVISVIAEAGRIDAAADLVNTLSAEGITHAVVGRNHYYRSAIDAAIPAPTTVAELQTIIDQANAIAGTLESAGNGTDNDEPISTQLIAAGISNVTESDTAAYERAIAIAAPAPTTAAQLQAIVDEVNAVIAVIAEINLIGAGVDIVQLLSREGIIDAVADRQNYYMASIETAEQSPVTRAELQVMIDRGNAIADTIESIRSGLDNGVPVSSQLIFVGINGVTEDNTEAYERAISGADPAPATLGELQQIIDSTNAAAEAAEAVEGISNGSGNAPIDTQLITAGISGVTEGNADAYELAISSTDPVPTTAAELQAIVDDVNTVKDIFVEANRINSGANVATFAATLDAIDALPTMPDNLLAEFAALVDRAEQAPVREVELVALAERLITRANTQPVVYLVVEQGGQQVLQASLEGGPITVTARISNPLEDHSLSYDWSATGAGLLSFATEANPISESLTLDLSAFGPGFLNSDKALHVKVAVTRNTLLSNADTRIPLAPPGTALALRVDSDGDGVIDIHEGELNSANASVSNKLQTVVGDGVNYIMEAEAGVVLRLGTVARTTQASQGLVSLDDVVDHQPGANAASVFDSFPADGSLVGVEVFDFELAALPHAGASSLVVLPLKTPMAAGTRYAKYHPVSGWTPFAEDGLNRLYSSPAIDGIPGLCLPVGHQAWSEGLTVGHACVQLRIEDGGPNDADRLLPDGRISADAGINGNIVDPGAIVRIGTTGTGTVELEAAGDSGTVITGINGGAFDMYGLLMLFIALYRRRIARLWSAMQPPELLPVALELIRTKITKIKSLQ